MPVARVGRWYRALVALSAAWAIANCAYVYFVLGGTRTYRIESSVFAFLLLAIPAVLATSAPAGPPELDATPFDRAAMAVAVVVWALVLVPFAASPFLSDDYVFVSAYGRSLNLAYRWEFFRPVFGAVFWALSRIGHLSPVPFHLAAYVLHVIAASLVQVLVRRVSGSALAATIAFALFLLNPLQLEATLWISGLQELLWSVFALAAVVVHSGSRHLSLPRIAVAGTFVLLAFLSKETAVCTVVLFLLFDAVLFRFDRGRELIAAYVVYGTILVVYLLARRTLISPDPRFLVTPTPFFLKQFFAIPYKSFVQPWNASAIRVPVIVSFLTACAAIGLTFFVVVFRGASSRALLGPAIILAGTAPLYGFFFVGANLAAARYLYLPAAGWALVVSYLICRSTDRRFLAMTMLVVTASFSAVFLTLNLRPWRTAFDLVERLRDAVTRDASVDVAVSELRRQRGDDLEVSNGIPQRYQGVDIFRNGYADFVALTTERTVRSPLR